MKTENERIVQWNEDRGLIKTLKDLDMANEMSFIVEEVIEGITDTKSIQAREQAIKLTKIIASGKLGEVLNQISFNYDAPHEKIPTTEENLERFVDALGDTKVFATGGIRKAGYNPDGAMEEVLLEIESRTGSIQNGKFVKDKSELAISKWYKADFKKAKMI